MCACVGRVTGMAGFYGCACPPGTRLPVVCFSLHVNVVIERLCWTRHISVLEETGPTLTCCGDVAGEQGV